MGSFGFATITPECRQIERIFREHETLSSKQLQALRVAIDKVQQTLDTSEPTLTPSPAFVDQLSVGPADNFIESAKDKAKAAKVLIVDDDPAILTLLEGLLQGWGFRLQLLSDSQQFWETMEQFDPDIVLLDVEMPQVSGFDLCQQLRDQPRWSELPVLCLSAHTEAEVIQRVFSIGADDYIRKPIIAAELIARVVSWLERARDRKLKAEVDPLTGVSNRQKSTQEMTRLLGLAKRYEQPFCLAVIDIDQFKRINDRFDHAVGDRILRQLGACLRSAFRPEDVIGRWGGEEFVVGLYGVAAAEGKQYLTRLLADWQRIQTANGTTEPTVTFTTGLATYPTDIDPDGDLQSLHQAADKALQTAKVRSRQRILAEVG